MILAVLIPIAIGLFAMAMEHVETRTHRSHRRTGRADDALSEPVRALSPATPFHISRDSRADPTPRRREDNGWTRNPSTYGLRRPTRRASTASLVDLRSRAEHRPAPPRDLARSTTRRAWRRRPA